MKGRWVMVVEVIGRKLRVNQKGFVNWKKKEEK